MSNIPVTIETSAGGFTAYARQGTRDHQATGNSPELAAKLAGAELLGLCIADVRAERKAPGVWSVIPRHGALVQQATP